MKLLIVGAAGMLGHKLAESIALTGHIGNETVGRLILVDIVEPAIPTGLSNKTETLSADISQSGVAEKLAASRPELIFHLAAIPSGGSELDFEGGYRTNLDGTRHLFDAIRAEGLKAPYKPRVVFSSSIAVFGSPFPKKIGDEFFTAPRTSYGAQKAMAELLLADYSRRGIFDGIGLRLPTICIRPGKPNAAASGFFSNILREPLVGVEAILPVEENVRHWHASPRAAVGFLTHASTMDTEQLGHRRVLNMPGLSATVGEQIEALRRVAGDSAVRLIRHQPDPVIIEIVAGWARDFDPVRALQLGFVAESSFDEIIRIHIDDELGGKLG